VRGIDSATPLQLLSCVFLYHRKIQVSPFFLDFSLLRWVRNTSDLLSLKILTRAATGHDAVAANSSYDEHSTWEDGKKAPIETQGGFLDAVSEELPLDDEGHEAHPPTAEEKDTLRRVAGKLPTIAYWLCAVEFAERASFYGVKPLFNNFVNKPFPKDGNGYGAPLNPGKSENKPGALDLGTVKASAVVQSFSMLVYALPVLFGWLADTRTGRYSLICWGVAICGISHVSYHRRLSIRSTRTNYHFSSLGNYGCIRCSIASFTRHRHRTLLY
jgi:hypothetical protein